MRVVDHAVINDRIVGDRERVHDLSRKRVRDHFFTVYPFADEERSHPVHNEVTEDLSARGAGERLVEHVVRHDVIAVGNPCRVVRTINDDDMKLIVHGKQMEIIENLE